MTIHVRTFAEHLHQLAVDALEACTERQRAAYQLVHGLTTCGAHTDPVTITRAAQVIGAPRQNVTNDLAHARAAVYEHIAKHLISVEQQRLAATEIEVPGTAVGAVDISEIRHFLHANVRTEQRIHLGPGSQAAESAGKHGTGSRAERTATIRMHQRYAA